MSSRLLLSRAPRAWVRRGLTLSLSLCRGARRSYNVRCGCGIQLHGSMEFMDDNVRQDKSIPPPPIPHSRKSIAAV